MFVDFPIDKERQDYFFFLHWFSRTVGGEGGGSFLEVKVLTVFYFTNLDILDISLP